MGRGSWVVGRGSWVVGRESWVVGRGSWVVGRGHESWVVVVGPPRSPCIHVMYTYFYAVSNALSQQQFCPRSLSSVYTE